MYASWISSDEVDDSDKDKNYLPKTDSSSSDFDICKPSTSNKVMKKKINVTTRDVEIDLYLTSDDGSIVATPVDNHKKYFRKVHNKTSIEQKGRKRVRNPDAWICNVRKQKLAAGEEYTSKKGTFVPAKVMKPPCSCRLKCSERLSYDERSKFI